MEWYWVRGRVQKWYLPSQATGLVGANITFVLFSDSVPLHICSFNVDNGFIIHLRLINKSVLLFRLHKQLFSEQISQCPFTLHWVIFAIFEQISHWFIWLNYIYICSKNIINQLKSSFQQILYVFAVNYPIKIAY